MTGFEKIEKKQKSRIITVAIALFILVILFLAGPAAAFTVTWEVADEGTVGEPIDIEGTIEKNTTVVFDDEFVIHVIDADTGEKVDEVEVEASQTLSSLGGYGYGLLGYGYDISTFGYHYGYGYGYGYEYSIANGNEISFSAEWTPETPGTYFFVMVNANPETDSGITIATSETIEVSAAEDDDDDGSGSSTTLGAGDDTTDDDTDDDTTTDDGTTTETVYNETKTVNYNEEQLKEVLSNMTDDEGNTLFTEEEIQTMIENSEEYEFEVNVKVDKVTDAQGNASYKTTVTTTITNNTGKDQKNVKVVVEVPKAVSETASKITSGTIFTVLKDDPILEFSVPLVKAGQTQTITYTVTDTEEPVLADATFSEPSVRFAEEVTETTTGDTPGETGDTGTVEQAMDWTPIIIVLIVLLAIIGVAYYKKDDIKKMMKK